MPQDNTNPQPKMIGFENLLNMTDKDRAQAVWDKAMWPEEDPYDEEAAECEGLPGIDSPE
jgi:hypothetical protein